MSNIPIIRIELESMKMGILQAFSERIVSLDADVQRAVDAYCAPENIGKVISDTVRRELDRAMSEAVQRTFGYGGQMRAKIDQLVADALAGMGPRS